MQPVIAQIFRYPVKSLSAQRLSEVRVEAGEGLPQDRRFALTTGAGGVDRGTGWHPPGNFLTLARVERLAALQTEYDAASETLVILRRGRQVARGNLGTDTGRMLIGEFFAAYLRGAALGMPRLVESPGVMYTDREDKLVTLINLASVRDLERVAGEPVDPARFRANLHIDGADAWAEQKWTGELLRIGTARLEVIEPIVCALAANVHPTTGVCDLNLPQILKRGYGQTRFGIYARVITGGTIRVNDRISGTALP
ncbi:MAG: MOSC domain-containing protein [Azospirillaceae bacterium]|nr:MOSC domain-containing protein [Azospirillaceae bacterium]